jgi:predicted transcriptional regulator
MPANSRIAPIDQRDILGIMTVKVLKEAMQRAESWPQEAQEELAEIALEIDARLKGGTYQATPDELAGIDRGLKAAREGRFATDAEVEAVFAKHRRL